MLFYGRLIYYHPVKTLTHMVTVYIVVYNIFIKLIRFLCCPGRGPLIIKLIYAQVIKYLLYNLIVFNKERLFSFFSCNEDTTRAPLHISSVLALPSTC